jgi:hypothetical protein
MRRRPTTASAIASVLTLAIAVTVLVTSTECTPDYKVCAKTAAPPSCSSYEAIVLCPGGETCATNDPTCCDDAEANCGTHAAEGCKDICRPADEYAVVCPTDAPTPSGCTLTVQGPSRYYCCPCK